MIDRTEEEFKKGHVDFDGALNIPYMFNTPEGYFWSHFFTKKLLIIIKIVLILEKKDCVVSGRVKNPKFMEQVLPVCNKDDHLIVVNQMHKRNKEYSLISM